MFVSSKSSFLQLICFTCILSACLITINQAQTSDSTDSSAPPTTPHRGFFDIMMMPIKSTIEHARRLLSSRIDNATEQMSNIRLQTFKIFMRLYNKTYSPEEIPRRMALFFERRQLIEESQRLYKEGLTMFSMRENEFTDWDDGELKKLAGVSLPSPDELSQEELKNDDDDDDDDNDGPEQQTADGTVGSSNLGPVSKKTTGDKQEDGGDETNMIVKQERIPASKDWRTSGCVSTPINQLKCGACYAIATMSVVESMRCINHVSSPILSPQHIVDCATVRAGYQNYGCDGGWPTRVLKYLQDTGTAARDKCYPFVHRQNACKIRNVKAESGCTVSASFSGSTIQYKVLKNERDILYHVAKTGPVVTVMKASDKFLYYSQGIFDDPKCTRRQNDVDHAIVIVGYGSQDGTDYWIIKNSWGTTTWGQAGYGLYRRGRNACSIGHWGWVVTG